MKESHNLGTDDISNCFKVLRKCRGKFDCLIFEMLYIRKIKPSRDVQSDSLRAKLFDVLYSSEHVKFYSSFYASMDVFVLVFISF